MNQLLKLIPGIIEKTFRIPARFRSKLPSDIAELSRLLTSNRGDRSLSYLNRPNLLSAYLHYYLPWNLYRLCLLLDSLDISLSANDTIIDLGSGTLTFVSALWIARPDLRKIPLEFICVDRSGQALDAGKKFFYALTGKDGKSEWKINLVREEIKMPSHRDVEPKVRKTQRKARLVCAVNLFNEIYERIPYSNTSQLKNFSADAAQFMNSQAAENACILTVEPGVPQSGRFISFLREVFLDSDYTPIAPCTHSAACPLTGECITNEQSGAQARASGTKKKWCHFAHTEKEFEPPKELVRLSAAAKLPKERLVYSYLLTQKKTVQKKPAAAKTIRVISDAFSLPDHSPAKGRLHKQMSGRYGCSEQGLVLISGEKTSVEKLASGSLVSEYTAANRLDAKSGAAIINL